MIRRACIVSAIALTLSMITIAEASIPDPPAVTAKGWIAEDSTAGEAIGGKDTATPRPIASLAKLMTALVVVERSQPDDIVTIPPAATKLPADASNMQLKAGEKWSTEDLLTGLLVESANDAAIALAIHIAGSEAKFVDLMNERAEQLKLQRTTFASSSGLDSPGATSTSTPADLLQLAKTVLKDRSIRSIVREPSVTLTRPGGSGAKLTLKNRNPLIGRYQGVDGVKTGFTDEAGYMLIVHHTDAESEGEVTAVLANSASEAKRVSDATALLDWAAPLRSNLVVEQGGEELGSLDVQGSSKPVRVFICDDVVASVRAGQTLRQEIVVPQALTPPINAGDEVGEIRVVANGDVVSTAPVCARDNARAETPLERIRSYARVAQIRDAWQTGIDEIREGLKA